MASCVGTGDLLAAQLRDGDAVVMVPILHLLNSIHGIVLAYNGFQLCHKSLLTLRVLLEPFFLQTQIGSYSVSENTGLHFRRQASRALFQSARILDRSVLP